MGQVTECARPGESWSPLSCWVEILFRTPRMWIAYKDSSSPLTLGTQELQVITRRSENKDDGISTFNLLFRSHFRVLHSTGCRVSSGVYSSGSSFPSLGFLAESRSLVSSSRQGCATPFCKSLISKQRPFQEKLAGINHGTGAVLASDLNLVTVDPGQAWPLTTSW